MISNLRKFELITWKIQLNIFVDDGNTNDDANTNDDNNTNNKYKLSKDEYYCSKKITSNDVSFLTNDYIYKRVDISNVVFLGSISKLQNSIEYLKLSNCFNFDIILPQNLLVLIFGTSFNQRINYTDKIFYIKYGNDFNQPINNLPLSLEFLILGIKFNQQVDNLPSKLKLLYLSTNFNNSVNFLPNNLLYLNLGENFNQSIDNLPSSLTELTFYKAEHFLMEFFGINKQNKCEVLVIRKILNLFDKNDKKNKKKQCENLEYNLVENQKHKFNRCIDNLPSNLEYLLLHDNYTEKINVLPKKIKYIKFGDSYDNDISFLSNYNGLRLVSMTDKVIFDVKKIYKCKSKKLTININDKKNNKSKIINYSNYFNFFPFVHIKS